MRVLVINGPNLNLLGLREPDIYGRQSYADLVQFVHQSAQQLGLTVDCFQSNHEGAIIDAIQAARNTFAGIVINAAAYTHTSIAIHDALLAVALPAVELHLSDISKREEYRRFSYLSSVCLQCICGKGFEGYAEALQILHQHLLKS
ncbi:MAG: type II 3-dehydroquinate dehydratase [Oligosphaeraceae bacterium]|nr:type II 3-dehydroquinate dehydratase [Oligosphaeraceae bacterium]